MESSFLDQIASILNIDKKDLSGELELESCQWDSIAVAEFAAIASVSFNIDINLYSVHKCRTVADLLDLIPINTAQSHGQH